MHQPSSSTTRSTGISPPVSMRRLVGTTWLRCGYTTGTCAAAAAKAATTTLVTGRTADTVAIETPNGTALTLDVLDLTVDGDRASCAVRKDGGDDPDATDGALIYASVERSSTPDVTIDGGDGIGRVTKPGLDQPVGATAINSVPRRMIAQAVRDAAGHDVHQGWRVTVSCPTGGDIARKTFNPKLGIVGGISILGTTGIVEPMSDAALAATTAREISIIAATGLKELLVVIGNYGETFARTSLGLRTDGLTGAGTAPARAIGRPACDGDPSAPNPLPYGVVKSSNFIGDAIAQAAEAGFEKVLVVGHLGKMVKVGIGVLNTHSNRGDGRIETLIACALQAGADLETLRDLLGCVSTDAAVSVLIAAGLLPATMSCLTRRVQATFERHIPAGLSLDWMCFTRLGDEFAPIAQSPHASQLVERWHRP